MTPAPRRLTPEDLPRLRKFWIEHWGSDEMVTRGAVLRADDVEGFVIEENSNWTVLVTFMIKDNECEVTSLDSLREGAGLGTQLIDVVLKEARNRACKRLFLITTNDNMRALRFYQKRGFELAALYRGALKESRKMKPSIPLTGLDGIPLRDEIELEIRL